MTMGWEGSPVTQAPFSERSCPIGLRIGPKELSKELTPLSSVACGASFLWRGLLLFVMHHW